MVPIERRLWFTITVFFHMLKTASVYSINKPCFTNYPVIIDHFIGCSRDHIGNDHSHCFKSFPPKNIGINLVNISCRHQVSKCQKQKSIRGSLLLYYRLPFTFDMGSSSYMASNRPFRYSLSLTLSTTSIFFAHWWGKSN